MKVYRGSAADSALAAVERRWACVPSAFAWRRAGVAGYSCRTKGAYPLSSATATLVTILFSFLPATPGLYPRQRWRGYINMSMRFRCGRRAANNQRVIFWPLSNADTVGRSGAQVLGMDNGAFALLTW
jgi:hypothetical protein